MEYKDRFTVYLSDFVEFDTDIIKGGGVPQTKDIQKVLDFAASWGALHLIVDGAVTTERLKVHSNTTIECLNSDCGFYLADNSDVSLFENANPSMKERNDVNISFIGGTYNFNCLKQNHDISPDDKRLIRHYPVLAYEGNTYAFDPNLSVFGFKFTGVENFVMRNVTTVDQRTYSMAFCNFKHCLLENVHIRLDNNLYAQNQDGIHFYGPGQFLTLRNIRGTSGDDFIALGPDEADCVSKISDVVIDGIHLENADQGIRLLCRKNGALERVSINNVTGTYKSFGFIINPWFRESDSMGCYDGITFDNIDLVQHGHKYPYSYPFLFRLGGNVKNMTFRNIKHKFETESGVVFDIGSGYDEPFRVKESPAKIENIRVEGALCTASNGIKSEFMKTFTDVETVMLQGVITDGCAVSAENAKIDTLIASDVICGKLIEKDGMVNTVKTVNVLEKPE